MTRTSSAFHIDGKVGLVDSPTTIGSDEGGETKVASHSHGGFERVVGDDTSEYDDAAAVSAQPVFEIGADEGAVRCLGDDLFAWEWASGDFEIMAGFSGPVRRLRFGGVVSDLFA